MIFGSFSTYLGALVASLWASSPTLQAFGNNTLVLLKSTEVMWRPVLSMSLTILKPIGAFALTILKPFGPLALQVADAFVRGMILFGFLFTHTILTLVKGIQRFMNFAKSMGADFVFSVQTMVSVLKDFTFSFAKIVNWVGYVFFQTMKGITFVLDSFDQCAQFSYRLLFEAHKVSWNDIYNISIPFFVVATIVGLALWRLSNRFASKPVALSKKFDDECVIPRRSSRLQRKRAFLQCGDLDSTMLASKEASFRSSNL